METFTISNSILVNIDFTLWTGRAKLDINDVPQAANLMPPKELYNSGSIKIFDTDKLKVFRNFKTRADLCAAALGLRVKGFEGWLVDENNINQLEGELTQVRQDWDNTLDDFVAHYPYAARDWANSCGKWDRLIAQKQPTEFEIRNRFKFGWWTVRITPESTHAGYGNTTNDLVADIPDQALQSVIDSLTELYDESFNKSGDPSPKAYNALRKIAMRARALGFANPNAARLAPVLLDIVNRKNHTLARLVLSRMDNPQSVLDVLQINDGQGIDSLLAAPIPTVPDPEPEPVIQSAPAPEPAMQSDISSLMDEAKRLLNTQTIPPLTAVNGEGDIIRTDTNEVVMSAREVAQVGIIPDEEVEAWRKQYDDGIITRSELMGKLSEWCNAGRITFETYKKHEVTETQATISTLRWKHDNRKITDQEFNEGINKLYGDGKIGWEEWHTLMIPETKQPEPAQPAPQSLNSMDVLDSLGLF